MELVCPAGNLPALKAAVDSGADTVYVGLNNETNARHFAGLNFTSGGLSKAIQWAHQRGTRVLMAINTYPNQDRWDQWQSAIDGAANVGVDGLILADPGVLAYATRHHPELPRHLSVQASATTAEALHFYHRHFGIRRAVLPRVLSMQQVRALAQSSPVALEVFGFGGLCIMAEGRCQLSSYVTGQSPNTAGVCSPSSHVRWENRGETLEARLNGVLIDRFRPGEKAGYPTLCKGRFRTHDRTSHVIEEPTSLNTLALLPELHEIGISAVKIEGRQRSPAYVAQVTRVWRQAIDCMKNGPGRFTIAAEWEHALAHLSEGHQTTLGAYERDWQ